MQNRAARLVPRQVFPSFNIVDGVKDAIGVAQTFIILLLLSEVNDLGVLSLTGVDLVGILALKSVKRRPVGGEEVRRRARDIGPGPSNVKILLQGVCKRDSVAGDGDLGGTDVARGGHVVIVGTSIQRNGHTTSLEGRDRKLVVPAPTSGDGMVKAIERRRNLIINLAKSGSNLANVDVIRIKRSGSGDWWLGWGRSGSRGSRGGGSGSAWGLGNFRLGALGLLDLELLKFAALLVPLPDAIAIAPDGLLGLGLGIDSKVEVAPVLVDVLLTEDIAADGALSRPISINDAGPLALLVRPEERQQAGTRAANVDTEVSQSLALDLVNGDEDIASILVLLNADAA